MNPKPPKRLKKSTGPPEIHLLSSVFCILSSALLYICRESSTNQPFLCKTNPILSAVGGLQMNVTFFYTKYYERNDSGESEKTNPKQTQSPKSQNECKLIYNKGLQKIRHFLSPNKQTQSCPP
jgi:hypothetical protein